MSVSELTLLLHQVNNLSKCLNYLISNKTENKDCNHEDIGDVSNSEKVCQNLELEEIYKEMDNDSQLLIDHINNRRLNANETNDNANDNDKVIDKRFNNLAEKSLPVINEAVNQAIIDKAIPINKFSKFSLKEQKNIQYKFFQQAKYNITNLYPNKDVKELQSEIFQEADRLLEEWLN